MKFGETQSEEVMDSAIMLRNSTRILAETDLLALDNYASRSLISNTFAGLKNFYEAYPLHTHCFDVILPAMFQIQKKIGMLHFVLDAKSHSADLDFNKAVEAFKESLRWASIWKQKSDFRAKMKSFGGEYFRE